MNASRSGSADVGILSRGEQLLELVDHQDQARRRGGRGLGWPARPGTRTAAGDGSDRELGQRRRLTRRGRQRPVHRHRVRGRQLGQLRRQLPQRATGRPDHPPRPPLRPRAQRARRQPRHQPRLQQRGLACTRLPGHQQDPRPVQPRRQLLHQLVCQLAAPVENPRVPFLKGHKTQIRAPGPHRAAARRGLSAQRRQHLRGRGVARAAATNSPRAGSARPSASASSPAVSLRAVRLMPRSRSLTDRGLRPAASASSSWVSPARAPQLPQQPAEPKHRMLCHRRHPLRRLLSRRHATRPGAEEPITTIVLARPPSPLPTASMPHQGGRSRSTIAFAPQEHR